MSLKGALSMMQDVEIDTLCITNAEQDLLGLITVRDIANANMDMMDTGVLADARDQLQECGVHPGRRDDCG